MINLFVKMAELMHGSNLKQGKELHSIGNKTTRTVYFPYYSTGGTSLDAITADQNVIIVQHGAARNAADYLCAMQGAGTYDGLPTPGSYVLIAPHFLDSSDHVPPPSNSTSWLYWNRTDGNGLWRSGENDALNQTSSFAVMDTILQQIPHSTTRNITLAGHSSGGQFVQRYALVGTALAKLSNLQYVVANPSSYVYFDDQRWNGTGFSPVPNNTATSCPTYNAWEWGFGDANARPPYIREANLSAEARVHGSPHVLCPELYCQAFKYCSVYAIENSSGQ